MCIRDRSQGVWCHGDGQHHGWWKDVFVRQIRRDALGSKDIAYDRSALWACLGVPSDFKDVKDVKERVIANETPKITKLLTGGGVSLLIIGKWLLSVLCLPVTIIGKKRILEERKAYD